MLRVVVPDLEQLCHKYMAHMEQCTAKSGDEESNNECTRHDTFVASLIEQCVRRESASTSAQGPFRRWVENVVLGDARKRGETHQWMYDRINLAQLLIESGYKNPMLHKYNTSSIEGWGEFGLDMDEHGAPHKKDSLYMEATK